MHAHVIVQRFIETQLTRIHAARRPALAAAVTALMQGHFLSLSRLARGLTGTRGLKAALKRIDRLIGHARIDAEAQWVAGAIAARLKTQGGPLVIAIDWSAVGPGGAFVELRASASMPGKGRGITIYQRVYPRSLLGNPKAERALLEDLYNWIGPDSEVIVITDAGLSSGRGLQRSSVSDGDGSGVCAGACIWGAPPRRIAGASRVQDAGSSGRTARHAARTTVV